MIGLTSPYGLLHSTSFSDRILFFASSPTGALRLRICNELATVLATALRLLHHFIPIYAVPGETLNVKLQIHVTTVKTNQFPLQ